MEKTLHRIFVGESPEAIIYKARALAEDFERLIRSGAPNEIDLAAAPILDFWTPAIRQSAALAGVVAGHALIRDGKMALTSHLFAIDRDHGWARTWSRYYRLGRPIASASGRQQ